MQVLVKLTSPERGGEQGMIQDQKTYENQPHWVEQEVWDLIPDIILTKENCKGFGL